MDLIGEISPKNIRNIKLEEIQKCGMSTRKAKYIKEAAEASVKEIINFENLYKLNDKNFIKEITKLKGVGIWTAEMLLIHSLERENILSYSDLGIRRGIEKLYAMEDISKKEFENFKEKYTPYGTVASIYLWEISKEDYKL